MNPVTQTLHPVVPNPYTLLSQIQLLSYAWFTCLNLKDIFFCICLAPVHQPLFVFEWTDTESGRQTQLTWTRLPQRFKNSTTIFSEALAFNLADFPQDRTGARSLSTPMTSSSPAQLQRPATKQHSTSYNTSQKEDIESLGRKLNYADKKSSI